MPVDSSNNDLMSAQERHERFKQIAQLHLPPNNWSLRKIGKHFNISYERVRQILKANEMDGSTGGAGYDHNHGSRKTNSEYITKLFGQDLSENKIAEQLDLSVSTVKNHLRYYLGSTHYSQIKKAKKYDLDIQTYLGIKQKYPEAFKKYIEKKRNVEYNTTASWNLTFAQWWEVWKSSGQWENRGTDKNGYVLTRKNTNEDFHKDNLIVCKLSECRQLHVRK